MPISTNPHVSRREETTEKAEEGALIGKGEDREGHRKPTEEYGRIWTNLSHT